MSPLFCYFLSIVVNVIVAIDSQDPQTMDKSLLFDTRDILKCDKARLMNMLYAHRFLPQSFVWVQCTGKSHLFA